MAVLRAKSDQVCMVEEDMISSNIKTDIHINVFILGRPQVVCDKLYSD